MSAKELIYEIKILGSENAVRNQALLREEISRTNAELKRPELSGEQIKKLTDQLVTAKAQMSLVTSEVKRQVAAAEELKFTEGSYKALNSELVKMKEGFRNLSEADRQGEIGKTSLARIDELDTKLKAIDAEMGQFQRNVGNYEQGIVSAFTKVGLADLAREQIKRLENQQEQLNARVEQMKVEYLEAQATGSTTLNRIEQDLRETLMQQERLNRTVDLTRQEFDQAQGGFRAFASNIRNEISGGMMNSFKQIGLVIASTFAVTRLVQFGRESLEASREAEKGMNLLRNAVVGIRGESEAAFNALIEQAEELSAANGGSIFGDDDIIAAQKFFAVFGLGSQQIKDVMPVIIEFATQNGLKLEEAASIFVKGINGQGRALKEYGITVKDSGDKNKNFADTFDQFKLKSKGAFDSLDEGEKKIESLSDSWDEFKEIVGNRVLPLLTGSLTSGFQSLYGWVKKLTDVPLSKTLEQERQHLFEIEIQLKNTNLPAADRNKLLDELEAKYPKYFENIDRDKISNEELSQKIGLVNKELINKIVLQKKQEEIAELADEAADRRIKMAEKEAELQKEIIKFSKQFNVPIPEGNGVLDQAQKTVKLLNDLKSSAASSGVNSPVGQLTKDIAILGDLTKAYNEAEKKTNDLTSARSALAKQLGVTLSPDEKTVLGVNDLNKTTNNEVVDKNADAKKKALEEQLKAQEEYALKLKQMSREILLSTLDADQKELEQVYDKYQLEIEALQRKNEQVLKEENLTAQQKKNIIDETNNQIIELSLLQDREYNNVLQRQAAETAKKIRETLDKIKISGPSSDPANPSSVLAGHDELLQERLATQLNPFARTQEEMRKNREIERELTIESLNDKIDALERIGGAERELFELKKQLAAEEMAMHEEVAEARIGIVDRITNWTAGATNFLTGVFESAKNRQLKRAEQEIKDEDRLGREKEKIQRRFAIAQKVVAITQAAINGALAITKILAEVPKWDWGVATWVQVGMATAATAASIATIASQKLSKGGKLSRGISNVIGGIIPQGAGMIEGPSHSGGGVKFLYNGIPHEAEGREIKTDNGDSTYIFTKGVSDDDVLKRIAMATHNSKGHPIAGSVASLVNMAAGGVPFYGSRFRLDAGGALGPKMPLPAIAVSRSAGADVEGLIREINDQNAMLYVMTQQRIDALERQKIAVPVQDVSDIQKDQDKIKKAVSF